MASLEELLAEKSRRDALEEVPVESLLAERARRAGGVPGIPEPVIVGEGTARSLEELTGGLVSRPLAAGLGGVVGTAVGAGSGLLTGPGALAASPAGAAVGGTLGAVGGAVAFENVEDLLGRLGVLDRPPSTIGQLGEIAAEEAALDVAVAGAGAIVRPVLGAKAAVAKLFGVTTERARDLIGQAQLAGVPVGASEVGGVVPKAITRALGVFPFTGSPALKNLAVKERAVMTRANAILDDLAPTALLRNELGIELTDSAARRFKAFKRLSARLAGRFDKLAANASTKEIIPAESIRDQAEKFVVAAEEGKIELLSGEALPEIARNQVLEFAQSLRELPENLTIGQYRSLMKNLRGLMDEVQDQGGQFVDARNLKEALEVGLQNIRTDLLPTNEARELRSALDTFNTTFHNGSQIFETATARRFQRADRNIFRAGPKRGGTLNPDEIADIALNSRSAGAIDDLELLVGKGTLKRAARGHISNALRLATESRELAGESVQAVNIARLVKELGLEGTKKEQTEGVNALLRRAGVDPTDFNALLNVAENIEEVGDPRTFVMRRVILGGAGALTGAAGAGAALGAGVGAGAASGAGLGTIAAATFLARRFSDIVTNPVSLKNMVTALDQAASTSARRQALVRAVLAVGREKSDASQGEKLKRGPS